MLPGHVLSGNQHEYCHTSTQSDGVERPFEAASKVPIVVTSIATNTRNRPMEKITTISLDLAKSVFQVHTVAEDGASSSTEPCGGRSCWSSSAASSRASLDLRRVRVRIIGRMPSASSGIWSG